MNANQLEKKFLQLEEKQNSMSSEIKRLESMIIDMKSRQGSKDGHDNDDEALEDFMATQKTLEEFEVLYQTLHKLRRHHGGKEGLNEKIVDENVELKTRIDEMGKKLEAKEGELKDLESLNHALMVMVHKSNNEIQETQEELDSAGKEKSNKKVVQLEKMLIISRNENFALKRKIDEMKKCMEDKEAEVKDLESFNQVIMTKENQEAREELINSMQGLPGCVNIGVKRLEELDLAPFAAAVKKRKCSGSGPHKAGLEQDSGVEATLLCSLWEKHLEDPGWHPFRMVTVGDKYQEVINDEDPKLKGLKSQLGEDAYKVVTTSLLEMNKYNLSGRPPVSELWNFKEGRKASLKEGFGFVFEKYDIVEVLEDNDSKFKVLVLEQVIGFKTVFKPKKNSGVDHIVGEITEGTYCKEAALKKFHIFGVCMLSFCFFS